MPPTDPIAGAGRNAWRRRARRTALPLLLLLIQLVLVHQRLVADHAVRPMLVPDSQSYINQAHLKTVNGALMHYRSIGYPAAIRAFGWQRLPRLELWFFFVAVAAFFAGVAAYAHSPWVGLAAATPLLDDQTLELLGRIQPDFVSCSLALLAVACLLALAVRPRHPALWVVFVVAVFAVYQMRPATLFLVAWLPVVGWFLAAVRRRAVGGPALRFAAALLVATWVPYLAFCSWRSSRVGDFGLVSFGGYNMSGLAAALVDPPMLDELEGTHHRLARAMYNMRQRRGWEPYRPGEGSIEWFEQYSSNIWRVGVAAAKQEIVREEGRLHGGESSRSLHVRINDLLRDVSRDIIRRRPRAYLTWVKDANLYGWKQLPRSPWVVWPALLLALSMASLWAWRRRGRLPPASDRLRASLALLPVGVTYFAAYVLLISLLSYPFTRYYFGTILLLPSALCAALAAVWLEVPSSRGATVPQRSMTADTSGARRGGGEA